MYIYSLQESTTLGMSAYYLLKEMDKKSFLHAIEIIISGDAYIHPNVTHNLVEDYRRLLNGERKDDTNKPFARPYHLYTKRECEILQLLTDGKSNRKIAETLEISEKTVKNHVSRDLCARSWSRDRYVSSSSDNTSSTWR